ncbi:Opsin-1 [Lachnellula suecica]|uniref:Opsin-1 n=1 Tax=Lachnellula suecica TaxID=602035 RepID=A0A8T9BW11_9HELO|nr:Opsin-1 [Lachnellula suecica]
MMDANQVIEAFKTKTSSLLVPTSLVPTTSATATSSVAPIPTVVPNKPTIEQVGETGTKTLWVVFVVMLLSTLVFAFLSFRVPVQKRLFHVITTMITLFATISYFAMATGDGNSYAEIVIKEAHKHVPDTVEYVYRQVFWARYVDWSLTTPLLLLDLALLAGMDGASIIVAIVADLIMVLLGLFAAFGSTEGQKWGYYAMACVAYLVIVYLLVVSGRRAVSAKDNKTAKLFASIGGYTLLLWTLYPIVWGIGDGARKWSVDSEIIAYAVLDILAKPVFGFWLIFAHASSNPQSIEGWWSHGLSNEGAIRIDDDGA